MPGRLKGKVVSNKMDKTVIVAVERVFAHPVYRKQVKITKRFKAHDESGAKVGDEVMIEETRPLSKEKRWRVVEVEGKPVVSEQPIRQRRSSDLRSRPAYSKRQEVKFVSRKRKAVSRKKR